MTKYILGKYDTDTYSGELKNEFHYLCMYLGAYLKYHKNPQGYNKFDDYAKANNLTNKSDTNFRWCYINEAQAFIRDQLNETSGQKGKSVSKREIRKLGFSGVLSIPKFPYSGCDIQDKLFDFVFADKNCKSVMGYFMDHISLKWQMDQELLKYYRDSVGEENKEYIKNTASNFCGFQNRVLKEKPKFRFKLQKHTTYETLQNELEKRKNHARE